MDVDGILKLLTHTHTHTYTQDHDLHINLKVHTFITQPIIEPYPKPDESNSHRHIFISKPVQNDSFNFMSPKRSLPFPFSD
jgi:hypothetical protein